MLFDAHTHAQFNSFKDETEAVIERALKAGVWLINAGTQTDSSANGVTLANKYPEGVYAAVALHPEHTYAHRVEEDKQVFTTREESFDYELYKKMALDPKVLAIGECGLDYYYFKETDYQESIKAKQREIFDQQIQLALELDKALMIHCRPTKGSMDAYEDVFQIISKVKSQHSKLRFQVHCYTGNLEINSLSSLVDTLV
jgi:TatD DNase family protein